MVAELLLLLLLLRTDVAGDEGCAARCDNEEEWLLLLELADTGEGVLPELRLQRRLLLLLMDAWAAPSSLAHNPGNAPSETRTVRLNNGALVHVLIATS